MTFFLGGNKAKIFRQIIQIILGCELSIDEYLASFIMNNQATCLDMWLSTK